MRLEGRVWREGKEWLAEVPMLDLMSQGRTRGEALVMVADAAMALANHPGFHAEAHVVGPNHLELSSNSPTLLTALMLRRLREARGLTLREVAGRIGQTSANAIARYEQGKAVPTMGKIGELLGALSPEGSQGDFVLRLA